MLRDINEEKSLRQWVDYAESIGGVLVADWGDGLWVMPNSAHLKNFWNGYIRRICFGRKLKLGTINEVTAFSKYIRIRLCIAFSPNFECAPNRAFELRLGARPFDETSFGAIEL